MKSDDRIEPVAPSGVGVSVQETGQQKAADRAYRPRPNADTIPCPGLAALYNHGVIRPDPEGNVTSAHFDAALSEIGLTKPLRKLLIHVADKTDAMPNSFNLFGLRQSSLNHPGSTGIRDPTVNVEQLPELLKFGENGRMYARHFALAANHFQKTRPDRGPGGFDVQKHVPTFAAMNNELTAALLVFGRKDEKGERYLTFQDVRDLWVDGKYPQGWSPSAKDSLTAGDFGIHVSRLGVLRLWDRLKSFFGFRGAA